MISPSKRTCFLIAPLGEPGSEIRRRYEYAVKSAVSEAGYVLVRADQISAPGSVTTQIIQHLLDASLAIADLTGSKPNVMYELAIRHTLDKPVLLVTTDPSPRIPFNIASVRYLIVDVTDAGAAEIGRKRLRDMIDTVQETSPHTESPLTVEADLNRLTRSTGPERPVVGVGADLLVNALKDVNHRLSALENAVRAQSESGQAEAQYSRRVFIVHGHDGELKNELARLLERLDFEPVILHEQPDRGQTIFEKLGSEMADVGFAFILLTPDDVGAMASKPRDLHPRARQNVVFEHGLFVSHLRAHRVCAILRKGVELPSDLHGVLYKAVPDGGGIRFIALELVQELRAAGYLVDANKL